MSERMTCVSCGCVGTVDDGCRLGGPCPDEECDGWITTWDDFTLDILSENGVDGGVPYCVRIVMPGDTYGLNRSIVHEDEMGWGPMIEFYDDRYHGEHFDVLGQFVSRYYIRTLLPWRKDVDLCLDGGIPSWTVTADAMAEVVAWLEEVMD